MGEKGSCGDCCSSAKLLWGSDDEKRILAEKLGPESLCKLVHLHNEKLHRFVGEAVMLCEPNSVFIRTDTPEDLAYIRRIVVKTGQEKALEMEGHTYHFDGPEDQGRDKANTKYLLPPEMDLGATLNSTDRDAGLEEIRENLAGSMKGRQMLLLFLCLGPAKSDFSIPAVQITDSPYVAHSEDILYRPGYAQFESIGDSPEFFRFLHAEGRLQGGVSADVEKRRIFIDPIDEIVYSTNTQYAGNTVGLKKLALRLAIRKADREGWLAEHMFVLGAHGPDDRTTYFVGAFPSMCGKTSTAMLPGETVIGDDIAYLRRKDNELRTVNVERGIFGIIKDVNPDDDPSIYAALTTPGEVIFSNILVKDGKPYWMGMGQKLPANGVNYAGEWAADGAEVPPSHKNARYTIRLADLENLDPRAEDPSGVPVGGVIYGGRDSDTWVPVTEAFDWTHGIVTKGAALESETTAATLGQEGVRAFCLMSNLDFLAIPLGRYIQNNLEIAAGLYPAPKVFSVNYFQLRPDGSFMTGMNDKRVWMKWMERRVHGDLACVETPVGMIPRYDDLARLFSEVLGGTYTKEQYVEQFSTRIPESLAKNERIEKIYRDIDDTPQVVFDVLAAEKARLETLRASKGNYVSPFDLA